MLIHQKLIRAVLMMGMLIAAPVLAWPAAAARGMAHAPRTAPTPDFAAIDAFVAAEMQATRLPGAALGIVQGDQIVHLRGFGSADPSGRAVTPQTPFTIGSTTKSFTALATMQLVEAGKVDLDAPVRHYVPWFDVADSGAAARITVRHLLNQTSGFPTRETAAQLAQSDSSDTALERYVRQLRDVHLTAPVGTTFQYSNTNWNILGLIVQMVAGQSFEQYVQQQIFAPLEMRNSFTSPEESRAGSRAVGHRYWFGYPVPYEMPYNRAQLPAGFINASAEDLTHYLIAQLNGGAYRSASLLSPAGVATLHRPAVPTGYEQTSSYAMGWFVNEMEGIQIVSHAGTTANFHANLVLIPAQRLGVVLLMNGENGLQPARIGAIGDGITRLLLGKQAVTQAASSTRSTFLWYALVILAVQLLALLNALRVVRRWYRQPAVRPRGWLRPALRIAPPFLLSLGWAFVCWQVLPFILGAPLSILPIFVPDLGYMLQLSFALALVWGLVKPILLILLLARRDQARPSTTTDLPLSVRV